MSRSFVDSIYARLKSAVAAVDSIPSVILIVFVLLAFFGTFAPNVNDENYLQLSKQFMQPDWIQGSHSLSEFPGTRLIYQYLVGTMLKVMSFEATLLLLRTLLAVLIAWPMARLYKMLGITNTGILLQLPVLFLSRQSMFGGSWILLGGEAKHFAYVFVFHGIVFFLRNQPIRATAMLVFATWFHILVGGYTFVSFFLAMVLLTGGRFDKRLVAISGSYCATVLPFIFYLKAAVVAVEPTSPSPDWIYTYFRAPHHTALFQTTGYFFAEHFNGVLLAVISLVFCIAILAWLNDAGPDNQQDESNDRETPSQIGALKKLTWLVIVSLTGTLIGVLIAIFDREGVILKYYPFRINSLSTFLLLQILTALLFRAIIPRYLPLLNVAILLLAAFAVQAGLRTNIQTTRDYSGKVSDSVVIEYIRSATPKDTVVLIFFHNGDIDGDLTLTRRMERERFVNYKFIPAEVSRIPEWYQRVLYKHQALDNPQLLFADTNQYRIDYVLSDRQIESPLLEPLVSDKRYSLYRILQRSGE